MSGVRAVPDTVSPPPVGEPQVRVIEHCWIPMADGIRLSARLWLPGNPGDAPTPAILEYIPYRKGDLSRVRDERNLAAFARRGYAGVRVDMRGTGDSEGLMTDMYGPEELDDAINVINWIARQPWCSGAVGMMGTSWGGTASLQAAARRPPPLKAIIAVCATNNRFDDDIHHMGGCLLTDTVEWGATLPAILAAPPDPKTVGPSWRRQWQDRLDGLSFPLASWIRHQTRDEYWRRGSVGETPDAITCPVLAVGGWADRYSNTVMTLLAQSHDRCWGIVGPWGHHYPDQGCPGPAIDFQQEALRWWDRWLLGVDNGADREPRLRVWQRHYEAPRDKIVQHRGRWIGEPAWPSERVTPRDLWLESGALRWSRGSAEKSVEIPDDLRVGAAAGDSGYFGRDGGLPGDQDIDDRYCLVFETEPLTAPLEILGQARLCLSLTTDQTISTVVARLIDVPPSGAPARVSCAVRNLALDDNGQAATARAPDDVVTCAIDFPNTAYRFEAGHRIRLALSSAYWPQIWPAPQSVRLTLHPSNARLTMPVRARDDADPPIRFAAPRDRTETGNHKVLAAPPVERTQDIDPESGVRTDRWHQPATAVCYGDKELTFGVETRAEHRLQLNDPNSARSRFEHRLRFSRDDWVVEVVGRADLTSTATSFVAKGSVEVHENGQRVFFRRWVPVLPRTWS